MRRGHAIFMGGMGLLAAVVPVEMGALYAGFNRKAEALRLLADKRRELQAMLTVRPAPTKEVAAGIEAELRRTKQLGQELRVGLGGRDASGGGRVAGQKPMTTADAYFEIAAFVERMRHAARIADVTLEPEERFGFAEYADHGPAPELITAVLRQRLMVERLLEGLFAARPSRLLTVAREPPGRQDGSRHVAGRTGPAVQDFFTMDDGRSVRIPGRVATTACKLSFVGQTGVLRSLLNTLASSELTLIVRSVEVAPAASDLTHGAPSADEIGGIAPLVAHSVSRFTVIVECLELVPSAES